MRLVLLILLGFTTCFVFSQNEPPVADFNFSGGYICCDDEKEISFEDLSSNNPTEWLWDFGDGYTSKDQNPTHRYNLISGHFFVNLVVRNSIGTDTLTKEIVIYDGFSFVERSGPSDTSLGNGAYYADNANDTTHKGISFRCYTDLTLKAVTMYARIKGQRLLQVRSYKDSSIVASKKVMLEAGKNRVLLEFSLQSGDYALKLAGSAEDVYYNKSGANWPYVISGLAALTNSIMEPGKETSFYFFYDWEFKRCSGNCLPNVQEINKQDKFNIYPNPFSSSFILETKLLSQEDIIIEVYDSKGAMIHSQTANKNKTGINLLNQHKGIYQLVLRINNDVLAVKKIVILNE